MPPKVSIIVPTHNRAAMLGGALESILKQGFTDWETLVVANGCRDRTAEVVGRYRNDPRFGFLEVAESIGGAAARNLGLDLARGEYIAFLDDDDEWLPEKLARQVAWLGAHPGSAIVSNDYVLSDGRPVRLSRWKAEVTADDILYENYLGSFSFCVARREDVGTNRINAALKACQDWDLWVKILSSTGKKGVVLGQVLTRYNDHDQPRLTTDFRKAAQARQLFLADHWPRLNPRQRSYHSLNRELYSGDIKLSFLSRAAKTLRYLSVIPVVNVRSVYKLVAEDLFGLRAGGLKAGLKRIFVRS